MMRQRVGNWNANADIQEADQTAINHRGAGTVPKPAAQDMMSSVSMV